MKITRVEPILIAVPYEHGGPKPMRPFGPWTHMETLFVRVDTDAGLTGWGEAFGFAALGALTREAILRVVAPLCEGREFTDVPAFMADLQRKLHAATAARASFALAGDRHRAVGHRRKRRPEADPPACSAARTARRSRPMPACCATANRRWSAKSRRGRLARAIASIKLHEIDDGRRSRRRARRSDRTSRSCATPTVRGRPLGRSRWRQGLQAISARTGWRSRSIRPPEDHAGLAAVRKTGIAWRPARTPPGRSTSNTSPRAEAIDHRPTERHQDRRHLGCAR